VEKAEIVFLKLLCIQCRDQNAKIAVFFDQKAQLIGSYISKFIKLLGALGRSLVRLCGRGRNSAFV
jgi:hypothetical protein